VHKYCKALWFSDYIFYCKVFIFWIDSTKVHKSILLSTWSHKTEVLNCCSYFWNYRYAKHNNAYCLPINFEVWSKNLHYKVRIELRFYTALKKHSWLIIMKQAEIKKQIKLEEADQICINRYSTWGRMIKPTWFCHIMLWDCGDSTIWNSVFWATTLAHSSEASARHVGHRNHTWR
jgi:hypothetical protein